MFNTFCLIILILFNLFLVYLTLSLNGKLVRSNSTNLSLKESYAKLLHKFNELNRTLSKTPPPLPKSSTLVEKVVRPFIDRSKRVESSPTSSSSSSPIHHNSSNSYFDGDTSYSSCSGSSDSGSSSCDSGSSGGSYD